MEKNLIQHYKTLHSGNLGILGLADMFIHLCKECLNKKYLLLIFLNWSVESNNFLNDWAELQKHILNSSAHYVFSKNLYSVLFFNII